jgi:hypothetical protein
MDQHQPAGVVEVLEHRADHAPEDMQPVAQDVGFVVVPRRLPVRHALEDHRVGHVQIHHRVQLLPEIRQQIVEKPRLGHRARKPVQNGVRAGRQVPEHLLDHGVDELVRHEFAVLDVFPRQQTQGGAVGGLLAEDVAEDDGVELVLLGQGLDEGALAGAGRTQECDVHGRIGFEFGLNHGRAGPHGPPEGFGSSPRMARRSAASKASSQGGSAAPGIAPRRRSPAASRRSTVGREGSCSSRAMTSAADGKQARSPRRVGPEPEIVLGRQPRSLAGQKEIARLEFGIVGSDRVLDHEERPAPLPRGRGKPVQRQQPHREKAVAQIVGRVAHVQSSRTPEGPASAPRLRG